MLFKKIKIYNGKKALPTLKLTTILYIYFYLYILYSVGGVAGGVLGCVSNRIKFYLVIIEMEIELQLLLLLCLFV